MISTLQTKTKPYQWIFSRLIGSILATMVVFSLTAHTANASVTGGLRAGITDDPDTGFLGGHLVIIPRGIPLRIEPSLELGFGGYGHHDDFFILRLNGNFKYMFKPSRHRPIYLYPILGLSMYHINYDDEYYDCHRYDCSHTEMGINLGFGVQLYGFMIDLTFGAGGNPFPDLTCTFGFTF